MEIRIASALRGFTPSPESCCRILTRSSFTHEKSSASAMTHSFDSARVRFIMIYTTAKVPLYFKKRRTHDEFSFYPPKGSGLAGYA